LSKKTDKILNTKARKPIPTKPIQKKYGESIEPEPLMIHIMLNAERKKRTALIRE
jgi:hypothetical protein